MSRPSPYDAGLGPLNKPESGCRINRGSVTAERNQLRMELSSAAAEIRRMLEELREAERIITSMAEARGDDVPFSWRSWLEKRKAVAK